MSSDLMTTKDYCLIVFSSTHHAMAAEKAVIEASQDHIIIPTPRAITASCGLALKIWEQDLNAVTDLLTAKGIGTFQPYKVQGHEIVRL